MAIASLDPGPHAHPWYPRHPLELGKERVALRIPSACPCLGMPQGRNPRGVVGPAAAFVPPPLSLAPMTPATPRPPLQQPTTAYDSPTHTHAHPPNMLTLFRAAAAVGPAARMGPATPALLRYVGRAGGCPTIHPPSCCCCCCCSLLLSLSVRALDTQTHPCLPLPSSPSPRMPPPLVVVVVT